MAHTRFMKEVDEARAEIWEEAIRRAKGNLAQAGREFGVNRRRAHELAKHHDLVDLARDLRIENGQPATGRPRGS